MAADGECFATGPHLIGIAVPHWSVRISTEHLTPNRAVLGGRSSSCVPSASAVQGRKIDTGRSVLAPRGLRARAGHYRGVVPAQRAAEYAFSPPPLGTVGACRRRQSEPVGATARPRPGERGGCRSGGRVASAGTLFRSWLWSQPVALVITEPDVLRATRAHRLPNAAL